jgi:hypothetical protein
MGFISAFKVLTHNGDVAPQKKKQFEILHVLTMDELTFRLSSSFYVGCTLLSNIIL